MTPKAATTQLIVKLKLKLKTPTFFFLKSAFFGGARDVKVIVVGNGHGNLSSNPG